MKRSNRKKTLFLAHTHTQEPKSLRAKKNKHLNCRINAVSKTAIHIYCFGKELYMGFGGSLCVCECVFVCFSLSVQSDCVILDSSSRMRNARAESGYKGREKCCEICANKNNMLQPLHISEFVGCCGLNRIQYANQNETFLSIAKQTAISSAYTHTYIHSLPFVLFVPRSRPTHTHTFRAHTSKEIKSSSQLNV